MDAIRGFLCRLSADRRGATAIEYGLIVALIAVAAIGGMSTVTVPVCPRAAAASMILVQFVTRPRPRP